MTYMDSVLLTGGHPIPLPFSTHLVAVSCTLAIHPSQAVLSLVIDADLMSVFSWNTKQVSLLSFVFRKRQFRTSPLLKPKISVSNALQFSFLDLLHDAFLNSINNWQCCDPSSSASQLFVFVCAEFETSKHGSNQVCIHSGMESPCWIADGG